MDYKPRPFVTAAMLAEAVGGAVTGNPAARVRRVALLPTAGPGALAIAPENASAAQLCAREFAVCLQPQGKALPQGPSYILTPLPLEEAAERAVRLLAQKGVVRALDTFRTALWSGPAAVGEELRLGGDAAEPLWPERNWLIGAGTCFGAGVCLGAQVRIGKNCVIGNHVTLHDGVTLGDNVILGDNVTLGGPAFVHWWDGNAGRQQLCTAVGGVLVDDGAYLGAGTAVQCGCYEPTRIGAGTQIAEQCVIGHDAQIGRHCRVVSQSAVAGWAVLGDRVKVFGQSCVNNMVTVGEDSTLLGRSAVSRSIPPHSTVSGEYARPHAENLRRRAFAEQQYRAALMRKKKNKEK